MINVRKTLTVGLAIATLGTAAIASSNPAAAWGYHHWGWGLGGAAAGLALGAAAATPAYYDYGYGCAVVPQAVVDRYGNVIRYRHVRVCY